MPGCETGRGSFLDQLLVPALRRAVTGRDPHDVAVLVADQLDLDVAWPGEVALDVHLVAAEEALRFALGAGHGVVDLVGGLDDLHPATAAAERRLDADRPAELLAEGADLVGALGELGRAGHDRYVAADRRLTARHLVAHLVHRARRRADELDPERRDRAGEVGVLAEEAVAGVDRVGAARRQRPEHGLGVDVALGDGLAAECVRLVGEPHVERIAIEIGVDRNGRDSHFAGRRG